MPKISKLTNWAKTKEKIDLSRLSADLSTGKGDEKKVEIFANLIRGVDQFMTDDALNLTGHDLIADYVRNLDVMPGVYRMLDAESRVLYVEKGPAFEKPGGIMHVRQAIHPHCTHDRETASMMFLTTQTETEALLLEQNLIKQLKPKYNVLLRDDKSFPNILS